MIPLGLQKHRPASPVVMSRMPDVGLGVLADVLDLLVYDSIKEQRNEAKVIFFL